MTVFNPHNLSVLTFAECLGPAMGITDPEDAKQYLKGYVTYLNNNSAWTMEESNAVLMGNFTSSEEMAKRSLGYYAGYYDNETRERVEKLFDCEHPMFGKISEMGLPSSDEAFQCGYQKKTLAEIRKQKQ